MEPENLHRAENIAVGIDGSINSRAAVRWAMEHAQSGDTVTLVHGWRVSPSAAGVGRVRVDEGSAAASFAERERIRASKLRCASGVSIRTETSNADPRSCLMDVDCALLVVGARGHGGVTGMLLGSVSTHLARHATCPVVIVPHEGRAHSGDETRREE